MLLYLTLIQTLALFCAHLLPCKASASLVNALLSLALAAVGGYLVHPRNLSKFWSWLQTASPQRWLLPVLVQDEYSADTLANSAGLQLCRNKQVSRTRQEGNINVHLITSSCSTGAAPGDHCTATLSAAQWHPSAAGFPAAAGATCARSHRQLRSDHIAGPRPGLGANLLSDILYICVQLPRRLPQATQPAILGWACERVPTVH